MSEKTRKGVENAVFIDVLSALGDMLNLQDDAYDESFEEVIKLIREQNIEFKKRFDSIDKRLDVIELNLNDKEKRLVYLEDYASWQHTALRHAIAITIGIVIGWGIHSMLSTFLH